MTHVMNAHVSFGSQPQYRPHASCAQIAPAMTANVHTGNANWIVRYASVSNVAALGKRDRNPVERPSRSGASSSLTRSAGAPSSFVVPPTYAAPTVLPAYAVATRRSERSFTKYRTVKMNDSAKRLEPVMAAITWILIQYELSAGTSGPAGAYRKRAVASARTPPPSAKPPT